LPRRVGSERAAALTEARLPLSAAVASREGLLDACFGDDLRSFERGVIDRASRLARDPSLPALLGDKRARRERDEAARPLEAYREAELSRMKLNFYGFDPSYHVARYNFVHHVPLSRTPLHLARHRARR
jgi:putative two-component system hydrogenase maturation factor HypX/HoxX